MTSEIANGQWQAGARVPSENELVQRLGVSRMTVNRALRELTQAGLIQRIAGDGEETLEIKVLENQILVRTSRVVLVSSPSV